MMTQKWGPKFRDVNPACPSPPAIKSTADENKDSDNKGNKGHSFHYVDPAFPSPPAHMHPTFPSPPTYKSTGEHPKTPHQKKDMIDCGW